MKTEIIEDQEESLDDLVVRARKDKTLKEMMAGKRKSFKDVLIFSEGTLIKAYDDENIEHISTKPQLVLGFVYWNGRLYDYGHYHALVDTFDLTNHFKLESGTIAACVFENDVFFAGTRNRGFAEFAIFDLADTKYQKVDDYMESLAAVNGNLYGGTLAGHVHDIFSGDHFSVKLHCPVGALFGFHDRLYCSCGNEVWDVFTGRPVTTENRPSDVNALAEYNGSLVDAGDYGIYDTFSNKPLIKDVKVRRMIGIPYVNYMRLKNGKD
jgi:hypothetical protein